MLDLYALRRVAINLRYMAVQANPTSSPLATNPVVWHFRLVPQPFLCSFVTSLAEYISYQKRRYESSDRLLSGGTLWRSDSR